MRVLVIRVQLLRLKLAVGATQSQARLTIPARYKAADKQPRPAEPQETAFGFSAPVSRPFTNIMATLPTPAPLPLKALSVQHPAFVLPIALILAAR